MTRCPRSGSARIRHPAETSETARVLRSIPHGISNCGQRRYTRVEIRVIKQVVTMADEGMTMAAIRRITELEQRLAEVTRHRDELARRLAELLSEGDGPRLRG